MDGLDRERRRQSSREPIESRLRSGTRVEQPCNGGFYHAHFLTFFFFFFFWFGLVWWPSRTVGKM